MKSGSLPEQLQFSTAEVVEMCTRQKQHVLFRTLSCTNGWQKALLTKRKKEKRKSKQKSSYHISAADCPQASERHNILEEVFID